MAKGLFGVIRPCPSVRIVEAVRAGSAGGRVEALLIDFRALNDEFVRERLGVIGIPKVFYHDVRNAAAAVRRGPFERLRGRAADQIGVGRLIVPAVIPGNPKPSPAAIERRESLFDAVN